MTSKFIWINGDLVPFEQATIPFLSPAFHYGLGVFEGIRCYNTETGPNIFRLREHMQRLVHSASILGFLDLPYGVAELEEAAKVTIRANEFAECYIRPVIHLAEGGMNLNIASGKAYFGIAVWEWTAYLGKEAADKGVRCNVSTYTRHHLNSMMTKAKITGNYPNSVMAKTESVRLGFDEAIMLDAQGYVAECSSENIFIIRDGVIYTPPSAAILEGITRESVMILARGFGYEVLEQQMSRDQLYRADEIFMTGTAAEVIAITEVDHRKIGSGRMGPITRQLQDAYHETVRGKHARSATWCTPVSAG
ncbi:MAG: branched-chain amino acid transaminase [Candidatus Sericytochromatia bacterium]|nr:branched-chain amino acid transaminase [Candidatus Sericytochromatia bacterium]